MHRIDRYIADIAGAKTIEQALSALRAELTRLGFEWFTYEMIVAPEGRQGAFLTNFPEVWIDRYSERRYARDDAVIDHAMRTARPFLWREPQDNPHLTAAQKSVFVEAADIGLKTGAIVPLHGPGRIKSLVSVANNMLDERFALLFAACRHELQLVATYAHEQLIRLGIGGTTPHLSLSPRELEVMTWTALGYSAWDISEKLSISAHTVKEHIDRSKDKLGAKNKTHAASICLSQGLIRL
jgi:DNA-binding CsgD family transcriptional regulator